MARVVAVSFAALALAAAAAASPEEAQRLDSLELQVAELKAMLESRRLDGHDELEKQVSDLTEKVQKNEGDLRSHETAMDSGWLCLCGALVMFMHAGFAMLEAGTCRAKNVSNVLLKNLVNVCIGTLGWWMFGWSFAYGGPYNEDATEKKNGFIGSDQFFNGNFIGDSESGEIAHDSGLMLSWFFQWAFCTAAATIVSGGVAERVKSPTYALYAFVMASFIYPVVVAWTWGYGWLSTIFDVGVMDFAGSGIVHLTGGVSALAGAAVLGARKGRFENPDEFYPHSLPLVVLGTLSLWFGWYGFNPGSTLGMSSASVGAMAAQVAMNTTLSAASAGLVVFTLRYLLTHLYDVGGLCNGILAGLVSITAPCGNVESGSAVLIGVLGGVVYQLASMLLQKLKIDDPVDASPVHGFCGIWGVMAAGLFDWGTGFDHFHGWSGWSCMQDDDGNCRTGIGGTAIAAQFMLALMVVLWAGTLSTLTFIGLKLTGFLRINEDTEEMGYDGKKHSPPKAYSIPEAPLVRAGSKDNAALPEAMA